MQLLGVPHNQTMLVQEWASSVPWQDDVAVCWVTGVVRLMLCRDDSTVSITLIMTVPMPSMTPRAVAYAGRGLGGVRHVVDKSATPAGQFLAVIR